MVAKQKDKTSGPVLIPNFIKNVNSTQQEKRISLLDGLDNFFYVKYVTILQ